MCVLAGEDQKKDDCANSNKEGTRHKEEEVGRGFKDPPRRDRPRVVLREEGREA